MTCTRYFEVQSVPAVKGPPAPEDSSPSQFFKNPKELSDSLQGTSLVEYRNVNPLRMTVVKHAIPVYHKQPRLPGQTSAPQKVHVFPEVRIDIKQVLQIFERSLGD